MPLPLLNRFLQRIDTLYGYIPVHSTQLQLAFMAVLHADPCVFYLARSTFFVFGAVETGCCFQTSFTIHNIINMYYYYYIKPDSPCQSEGNIFSTQRGLMF
jgi:hypothetical protein